MQSYVSKSFRNKPFGGRDRGGADELTCLKADVGVAELGDDGVKGMGKGKGNVRG